MSVCNNLTLLAEDLTFLQVEGALTHGLTALGADEAHRVEGLLQCIHTLLQHKIILLQFANFVEH